ncbi:hypothetical protein DM02DRAFT_436291 [Periconia macrospinosa]|uniref:Inhibitor of apoptosis repeat-containing protein n=1 Tax=Periconia macrospinosa TaxID=97972 RepID=A0A2V1CXQ0_9PLEO|nr:hypothetical protein DM02DRAFT_436291 [Periconia macrospinosa]
MAAASGSSNRFAPLSLLKPEAASRSNSPSRPNASHSSRNASPPPQPKQQYRTIEERLRTYPKEWEYTNLTPQQLATCGFYYDDDDLTELCVCPDCGVKREILELDEEGERTNEELLTQHADCTLADIIFDLVINHESIYKDPKPQISEMPSQPSPLPPPSSSTQSSHSSKILPNKDNSMENAAATPPHPALADYTKQSPLSPSRPSYAAIASRHCPPTPPSPLPSKPHRTPSTPLAPKSKLPTLSTYQSKPVITSPQISSPVLSIHDLERRFQHTPNPCNTTYPQYITRTSPNNALTRLLHAIADLLGSCNLSHIPISELTATGHRRYSVTQMTETKLRK